MKSVLLIMMILPMTVFAQNRTERNISAYRPLDIDYTVYENRAIREKGAEKILFSTPIGSARLFSENFRGKATGWKTPAILQKRFEEIRDHRFLVHNQRPDFPRRISWLYPYDGCYSRAALFNRIAFRMFVPVPNKIFAFGNLRVKTRNARRGVVGWWYHVAPIVEVGTTKYVLDPSIEPERPLELREWLSRMGKPEKIKIAICGSGTYSPGDNCDKETDGTELLAEKNEKHFLQQEESSLRRMGRKVDEELGEAPPWITDNQ